MELPVPVPAGDLRIILPNKVELIGGRGWAADHVAQMAIRLAVL